MPRLSRILPALCAASVSLLQQSRDCWAAETTQPGVTASVFAGSGEMVDASNEVSNDAYDVHRFGLGFTGILRFRNHSDGSLPTSSPPTDAPPLTERHDSGAFLLGGFAEELEWTRQTECSYFCKERPAGPLMLGSKTGFRLGAGYSFSLVEFRVGALGVVPSSSSVFPDPIWSPDVMLRVGPRDVGWGELGLGAYDASTTLRPGAYVGGGGGRVDIVRVTGHLGIHLVDGLCCSSTLPFGLIAHVGVERAFSRSLIAGVDFKWETATRAVLAGGAHLTVLL